MKLFAHALKEELKDCFLGVLDSLTNSLSLQIQGDTLKVLVIEKNRYFSTTENTCDIFQEFILQEKNDKQSVRILTFASWRWMKLCFSSHSIALDELYDSSSQLYTQLKQL